MDALLFHKSTGEAVRAVVTLLLEQPVVVVHWTLCGDYALRLRHNELYGYGPAFGIRRTPTGWGARNLEELWEAWRKKKDERRVLSRMFGLNKAGATPSKENR
jgi:hypothetical protein